MFIAASILIVLTAAIALVAINRASNLARLHSSMKTRITAIPAERWEELKYHFKDGVSIYYNLAGQSSIFAVNSRDSWYETLDIDRWAVERPADSPGEVRLLIPDLAFKPDGSQFEMGGWTITSEVGSSLRFENPRLDPASGGRLILMIIDLSKQGIVFGLGHPAD